MHCVQEAVKILELSFKTHQHQKLHTDGLIVKILAELMEEVDLSQSLVFEILVVWVSPNTANSEEFGPFEKSEFHQIDSVGMLF